jgi:hypothetical protein
VAGTWRWRGRDCREGRRGRGQVGGEEDGGDGGGSGGTVRVVDALAPALRCSRDWTVARSWSDGQCCLPVQSYERINLGH